MEQAISPFLFGTLLKHLKIVGFEGFKELLFALLLHIQIFLKVLDEIRTIAIQY